MAIKIGTGPDSWGVWTASAPGQVPWEQYLDEAAEAGYEWTEMGPYGYLPTDPSVLRSELDSRGLQVTANAIMAGHLEEPADWPRLEKEVVRFAELGAAIGSKYFFLFDTIASDPGSGEQVAPSRLDEDGWKRLIETVHRMADIVRGRFGLPMTFHPHADTHVQYEDQIEAFLDQTDPDRVSLLLDTGHHAYAGGDPVSFLRRHRDRISYLHLKNVEGGRLERVRAEKLTTGEATRLGVFCELDQGVVDFSRLLGALRETGYDGWATVEQDMYRPPLDVPLPIATRTRDYLRQIGIG